MHGVVKKWGGSLAIRLDMESSRKAGLKEGMEVDFELRPAPLDFASLPTVKGSGDDAENHDKVLNERR